MEKLSRVKKYEDLREQIERNEETSMDVDHLPTIEPAHYKQVSITDTPRREQSEEVENTTDTFQFKNEFLDEFISEVREYNLKKGNRVDDDTQMDILSQLKGNTMKRTIEPVVNEELTFGLDDTSTMSKDEIAKQVQELLAEEPVEEVAPVDESGSYVIRPFHVEEEEVSERPVVEAKTVTEELPVVETMKPKEDEQDQVVVSDLIEQTQKMKVQLENYEEELTDLNDGLDRTHRMLNVILCLLIIALLVAIAFVGYYLVKSGGII